MGRTVRISRGDAELYLVAKLVDMQACPATSSSRHYGLVMKYEVKDILEGDYSKKYAYVLHGAPELPRYTYYKFSGTLAKFEIGGVHRLRVKKKLRGSDSPFDAVVDPYHSTEPNDPRFLCIKADPEPEPLPAPNDPNQATNTDGLSSELLLLQEAIQQQQAQNEDDDDDDDDADEEDPEEQQSFFV